MPNPNSDRTRPERSGNDRWARESFTFRRMSTANILSLSIGIVALALIAAVIINA
jgi:hypothetical protein